MKIVRISFFRRDLQQAAEHESLVLEGDIGGGLVLQREISIPGSHPKVVRIESSIIARSVGAGSGGFSRYIIFSISGVFIEGMFIANCIKLVISDRLVCLRVHPTFTLVNPAEVCVKFTAVDGAEYEFNPEMGEKLLEATSRPNGITLLFQNPTYDKMQRLFQILSPFF